MKTWQSWKTTLFCFLPTVSERIWLRIGTARPSRAATSVRGIPHGTPAAAATANSSSSLYGRRAFHLAVPGRRRRRLPQSSLCPGQSARGNCRPSILRCTFDPARRSGNWHPTYGNCGLAELPATTDCQASIFGRKSGGRDLHGAVCCVRSPHQGVSISDRGCLQSAALQAALGSVTKQRTAAWHQAHSLANMPSRVALRLQPSPLTWTTPTNLERCLKVHFVEQALNSSVCQVTFTISGRRPVKTCGGQPHGQPYSIPPLPTV